MRIKEWGVREKNGKEFVLDSLHADESIGENWTTVITGVNGTKKSLVLRSLLEGVLGVRNYFKLGSAPAIYPRVELAGGDIRNATVIAIAGTPLDRFPVKTVYRSASRSAVYETNPRYTYLGFKNLGGGISSAHSMRTVCYLMLETIQNKRGGLESVRDVLSFLGLKEMMTISFRRHKSFNESRRETLEQAYFIPGQVRDDAAIKFLEETKSKAQKDADYESQYGPLFDLEAGFGFQRLISRLRDLPEIVELTLLPNGGEIGDIGTFSLAELLALVKLNIFSIEKLFVTRVGKSVAVSAASDLSSGQWQVLYSMLGLTLTLKDNALVLIDEPENSLHPDWQRQYINFLEGMLKRRKGCHVIIATHSPLIASGVREGAGNVIRFARDSDGPLGVVAEEEELTYGWDVGDVFKRTFDMESTRAISFMEAADEALGLVRDGKLQDPRLRELAQELVEAAKKFPDTDSMRSIVYAINDVARGEG